MFDFIHKVLLLKQLVLGSKEGSLIYFAFLHNLTPFADFSVFIKYFFLGADVLPLFVIEHIAGSNLFYGFG